MSVTTVGPRQNSLNRLQSYLAPSKNEKNLIIEGGHITLFTSLSTTRLHDPPTWPVGTRVQDHAT